MKNITKILSVALVAMMVLSLSAVALADDTTVYIPARLSKLGVDAVLDDFVYPTLKVKMSSTKALGDPCPIVAGDEADYLLYFSEKPDWAGAVVSSLDGSWINIDVDDSGFGMIEGPLHRQPGMWSWSGPCDPITGKPKGHGVGGDYPYYAGKDYGDYSVNVSYYRNGKAYKVVVTLKDSEDFFRTGMEGGVMSITFERVNVELDSIKGYDDDDEPIYASTDVWYISQVSATYPEGNYIIGVEADFRNDRKQNLYGYKVSYAVSEKEIYKITYAPNTASVLEDRDNQLSDSDYTPVGSSAPSTVVIPTTWNPKYPKLGTRGVFIHHYTADEAIYGEFYASRDAWADGKPTAVSGSGNKLNKWYKPGHGAQVRNIKKGTTSFKSPRVK
jgi:hypothetical protein